MGKKENIKNFVKMYSIIFMPLLGGLIFGLILFASTGNPITFFGGLAGFSIPLYVRILAEFINRM